MAFVAREASTGGIVLPLSLWPCCGDNTTTTTSNHSSRVPRKLGTCSLDDHKQPGTKYMTAGQAYGSGIYMADQLQVSLTYAGVGGTGAGLSHWPLSSSGSSSAQAVIVAVCEVIDK